MNEEQQTILPQLKTSAPDAYQRLQVEQAYLRKQQGKCESRETFPPLLGGERLVRENVRRSKKLKQRETEAWQFALLSMRNALLPEAAVKAELWCLPPQPVRKTAGHWRYLFVTPLPAGSAPVAPRIRRLPKKYRAVPMEPKQRQSSED